MLLDSETKDLSDDVLILLGNLANFHKFEGRNLCLQRLEDLVEESVMRAILETVRGAVRRCRQSVRFLFIVYADSSVEATLRWQMMVQLPLQRL
jgi:hypothetical protein